ncbi:MAG TPA: peptide chain release factor N(5)-glutamine methyltransferase [Nitrospinota bacterium]|nr:peptide chain release factor N(5)-glutamine methyltransferase [Nitrospinota bacterium]
MTRLIREALVDATRRLVKAGVGSPALDAQILLSHAMGINKCTMLARSNEKLNEKESINIDHFITRREKREPVAYITGKKEFFSINFTVDKRALIPRPETELLVSAAMESFDTNDPIAVLDLGSGCGAIAISLAYNRPKWKVTAADISLGAIELLRENAHELGLTDSMEIVVSNLFNNLCSKRFNLIISNPPYLNKETDSLEPEIQMYEPELALYADRKGLGVIHEIINNAHNHLEPQGKLMLEIGFGQSGKVLNIFNQSREFLVDQKFNDLQGIERVISAKRV